MEKLSEEGHFGIVSGPDRAAAIDAITAVLTRLQSSPATIEESSGIPILLLRKNDDVSKKALAKRIHDLRGALRTLTMALESIKEGYRFDDTMADAKVTAMQKALLVLERESRTSLALLNTI